jgi:hypothetical protein
MRDKAEFADVELVAAHVGGELDPSGSKVTGKLNMNGLRVDQAQGGCDFRSGKGIYRNQCPYVPGTMSRRVLTKRESAARLRSVCLPPDSCWMARTSAGLSRANKRHLRARYLGLGGRSKAQA